MVRVFFSILVVSIIGFSGCNKKDYYTDTGKHDPNFNGTVLDYLKSKPEYFDTLVQVIKLAGMEDVFQNEEITFFAPPDSTFGHSLAILNLVINGQGGTPVTRLDQIKPSVWRQQISRYLFKGAKSMNDYPQIDDENLSAFPGQIYNSYDGRIMNIGVKYNDVGGVKYAGYRELILSYIPSLSTPKDYRSWYNASVSSVNIKASNGYVHVLKYATEALDIVAPEEEEEEGDDGDTDEEEIVLIVSHFFGFSVFDFIENVTVAGVDE